MFFRLKYVMNHCKLILKIGRKHFKLFSSRDFGVHMYFLRKKDLFDNHFQGTFYDYHYLELNFLCTHVQHSFYILTLWRNNRFWKYFDQEFLYQTKILFFQALLARKSIKSHFSVVYSVLTWVNMLLCCSQRHRLQTVLKSQVKVITY